MLTSSQDVNFCAQGVIKKFTADQAVENVNLKDGKVRLVLKDGMTLPDERIRAVLGDAGYTAGEIERKENR